jgi:hypothetical protein
MNLETLIAWETEHGIGVDVTEHSDTVAAVDLVSASKKAVAWIRIEGSRITSEVVEAVKRIECIEVIDLGYSLPSPDIILQLLEAVEPERLYVNDDESVKAVAVVLKESATKLATIVEAGSTGS